MILARQKDFAVAKRGDEVELHGWQLLLTRIFWFVTVVPAFSLLVMNIPIYYAALHRLRPSSDPVFAGQLTQGDLQILQSWGISLNGYALCMVGASLLFHVSYAIIGVLLFWRKSYSRIALLTSFALMFFPFGYAMLTLQGLPKDWAWLIPVLSALGNMSIMLSVYLFPDGSFKPAWTRWLALAMVIYWTVGTFFSWGRLGLWPSLSLFFGFILSTLVVLLYRYRYVSTLPQRQQTKWLVYGASLAILSNIVVRVFCEFILPASFPGNTLYLPLEVVLVTLSMLIIPPTFGIAILSSRLWDVDVIINRTLVYGFLSLALTFVYIGLVFGLQASIGLFFSNESLVVVISTLAIAALFQPLRMRIQQIIDQRFYRRRYDATQAIEMFSSALREEIDLEQLCERLITVVEQTMQPDHISLWLAPISREEQEQKQE